MIGTSKCTLATPGREGESPADGRVVDAGGGGAAGDRRRSARSPSGRDCPRHEGDRGHAGGLQHRVGGALELIERRRTIGDRQGGRRLRAQQRGRAGRDAPARAARTRDPPTTACRSASVIWKVAALAVEANVHAALGRTRSPFRPARCRRRPASSPSASCRGLRRAARSAMTFWPSPSPGVRRGVEADVGAAEVVVGDREDLGPASGPSLSQARAAADR